VPPFKGGPVAEDQLFFNNFFFCCSSLNQSLFESRTSQGRSSVGVGKPLMTSCSDVWLARKGHAVKPPTGSFHSHDFQMVMGFILSGIFPR